MSRVAVLGAAGYVGRHLCRVLTEAGHQVVAVARSNGKFLLADLDVELVHPEAAASVGQVAALVNLAHPGPVFPWLYSRHDREIARLVQQIAASGARVVHASSIAVFGYGLDHAMNAAPVHRRRDYAYIESKINQENLLRRAMMKGSLGRDLQIVRLGNVWGPASPGWTAMLAGRLLFGDPVGVEGIDGYSNVTDVANAASYLAHLAVARPEGSSGFHHLAEFSDTPWSFWIDRMAAFLQVDPVRSRTAPHYAVKPWQEIQALLAAYGPLAMAKGALRTRFLESWMRSVLQHLPQRALDRLERRALAAGTGGSGDDKLGAIWLTLFSAKRYLRCVLDPEWCPPVDRETSWLRVRDWLDVAGYGAPQ